MGKRLPETADAQKNFTAHFILFVPKGTEASDADVQRVDAVRAIRELLPAGGGRATMSTTVAATQ